MNPLERDLTTLLANIRPTMSEDTYVFCTVPAHCGAPPNITPLLTFREQEGTSLILTLDDAKAANLNYQFPSRMITLNVYSSLDAVGFLAAITARLAGAGISVNPVSAYHHDHLFIPVERAEEAMRILGDMS
jgi:uncharacterized protein